MMPGNGSQFTIPPGFRFHPTDEELLYYYLRKKVAFEPIDLDVIRDVDLNKLEPWDLKERCNIGSGPQNDWYFFSHKDKKYPTGTRTNRATTAGFWKATGRDKAIHLSNAKRIGMRKTLVFYIGRAPHGQKTDWIMHEYRLEEDSMEVQEDGWVVCRVFKKKNLNRGITPESILEEHQFNHFQHASGSSAPFDLKQNYHLPCDFNSYGNYMHLPQLLSTELPIPSFMQSSMSMNTLDLECTNNLMKLTSEGGCQFQPERPHGDWSILDKLLATNQNQLDQLIRCSPPSQIMEMGSSVQRFPFQYLGCEADLLKFSK